MKVIRIRDSEPVNNIDTLCKAVSSWYVRRDSKFYDIDNLTTKLSMIDVRRACIHRIGEQFSETPVTADTLKAVFKRTIDDQHNASDETIAVWNGRVACRPGQPRLIWENGTVTVNTWIEPHYRQLAGEGQDLGAIDDFLEVVFQRQAERETILNWLAWCLQHEDDKPAWAPFLYSRTKGSGKSTFCHLVTKLFGEANSVTQNNVDKLTSRFNMTALQSKLVISEELQLKPDSTQSNALKTYITEKVTLAEMKGQEAERIEQCCCFLFTTNHLPIWIEGEDRRYYVVEIDHDGHAMGPRSEDFQSIVAKEKAALEDPEQLAILYRKLMARDIPTTFNAKSLNIEKDGTAIMQRIQGATTQVTLDMLEEYLNELGRNTISQSKLAHVARTDLNTSVNALRHMMTELGWNRQKVKWGRVDHARAIWVRPGYTVENGKVYDGDGNEGAIDEQELDHSDLSELNVPGRVDLLLDDEVPF